MKIEDVVVGEKYTFQNEWNDEDSDTVTVTQAGPNSDNERLSAEMLFGKSKGDEFVLFTYDNREDKSLAIGLAQELSPLG